MDSKVFSVIDIFIELVRIDSVSGEEREIAQFVKARLESLGLNAEIDKHNNVICKISGDASKEPYLLTAHLDTVEPGRGIEPFIADDGFIRSKGETILGADNKTAVAMLLALAETISNEKEYQGHPLEIVFTTSEETGNHGAHGLDYAKLDSKVGFCSDASNRNFGDMIVASPFYERFDIQLTGISAHASQPDLAKNVTKAVGKIISTLQTGWIDEETLCNVGIVRMGEVVNTIPGEATISGEVRSFVESNLKIVTDKIKATVEEVSKGEGIEFTIEIDRENGGFKLDQNHQLLQKALPIVKDYNDEPKQITSLGCYDANVFAENGIYLLNIADGSMDSHTSQERIHKDNLVNLVKLFRKLVE